MASEFGSYVGRLISVRSVVQLYPGPLMAPLGFSHTQRGFSFSAAGAMGSYFTKTISPVFGSR
jgi:hypothetical protein